MENGIGEIQLKFLRQIVRKDGLENVTLSGHIDGERERWGGKSKQRIT